MRDTVAHLGCLVDPSPALFSSLLKPNGRAAIVVPDNVLFEGGAGEAIRRRLLRESDVHTLLRLPTGIFYAHGVKANVIFFEKRTGKRTQYSKLWVYDLRSQMRVTLRNNPLTRKYLTEFVNCYRADSRGKRVETWSPETQGGRWRAFGHDELEARDKCSWDLSWLRDDAGNSGEAESPALIAKRMITTIEEALRGIQAVAATLGGTGKPRRD